MSIESLPQTARARVLLADDQPHILAALELLLNNHGYQTRSVSSPAAVLAAMQGESFDAVMLDLNYTRDTTGGGEGLELLSRIRLIDDAVPLVVMTAWSSVSLAVDAMRRGASDFIQKPWDNSELLGKIREQVERCHVLRSSQHRREEESSEASEIQKGMLPSILPHIPGYDISAVTRPMHFVGADYYNVVRVSEAQVALCIADAAGKGLPGALLMANLQAAIGALIDENPQPQVLCTRLNRTLYSIMPGNKFISLFYGVLDTTTNRLTYCNAGHNPPLLLRAEGGIAELASSGAVLGHFPEWQYTQADVDLAPQDTIVLFTDGVVEAHAKDGEPFGEQRVIGHFSENHSADATSLLASVAGHCGHGFQDDATIVVLKSTRRE